MIYTAEVLRIEPDSDIGFHLYCYSSSKVSTETLRPENKSCIEHFQKQVSRAHAQGRNIFLTTRA